MRTASGRGRGGRAARLPRAAQRTVGAVREWARARARTAPGAGPLAAARSADRPVSTPESQAARRGQEERPRVWRRRGWHRRRHVGSRRGRTLVGDIGPAAGSGDRAGRERDWLRSARTYRMALTNALLYELTDSRDRPCRRSRRPFRSSQGFSRRRAGSILDSRHSGRRRQQRCRLPHCPDDPQGGRSVEGEAGCPRSSDGNHGHHRRRSRRERRCSSRRAPTRWCTPLAEEIERHFASLSWRSRLRAFVHGLLNRARSPHRLAVGSLDAADALEQGLDRYEELELSAAATSFERASQADPLSPLPVAWRSRVARLMRKDVEATQLARQAVSLISDETTESERHFVAGRRRRVEPRSGRRRRALSGARRSAPGRSRRPRRTRRVSGSQRSERGGDQELPSGVGAEGPSRTASRRALSSLHASEQPDCRASTRSNGAHGISRDGRAGGRGAGALLSHGVIAQGKREPIERKR